MKILVNAATLRHAGGRSVGLNFLRAVHSLAPADEVLLVAPFGYGYEDLSLGQIRLRLIPAALQRFWVRPYLDQFWFQRQIEAFQPDVIFSMGNVALPTSLPQLVLLHWPYAVYPKSEVWKLMDVKSRLLRRVRVWQFKASLRYASAIAVQTETMKKRLQALYGWSDGVHVVPNAVSLPSSSSASNLWHPPASIGEGKRLLLCLSRYYPHKNLEVLLDVAHQFKEQGAPFVILTTLSSEHHPKAVQFLSDVERRELQGTLVNIGPVPMAQVPSLYGAVDGLLLPTLLESFSGTYAEAMFYRVPVFTSDLDFARDVCQEVAFYFDPKDASDIVSTISRAFQDEAALEKRRATGNELVTQMPTWHDIAARYLEILHQLPQQASS
jgi:glycosyltransferase involved in cell wall biosynthesis